MANASKRVQVGFKADVLDALELLSNQTGDSLSKIVSTLVEQALTSRGLLQESALTPSINNLAQDLGYTVKTVQKKAEPLEDEDLKMLQKLKTLKELGLF